MSLSSSHGEPTARTGKARRADTLRDYTEWRRLVADAIRLGIRAGRFTTTLSPQRLTVLAIALIDGLGIPLALGDPSITVATATQDVLTTLATVLRPSRSAEE